MIDRWLSGRKEIGRYLGVAPRSVARLRAQGAPIIVEDGALKAKTTELDAWRRARAEGRCPRDGALCPLLAGAVGR